MWQIMINLNWVLSMIIILIFKKVIHENYFSEKCIKQNTFGK